MNDPLETKKINLSFQSLSFLDESKKIIAIVAIAFSLFSFLYSLTLPPVYVSEIVLVPAESTGGSGSSGGLEGLARIAGFTTQAQGEEETALAILNTRDFLQSYIEKENLMPVIFPDQWDSDKNSWKGKPPNLLSGVSKLKNSINVFKKNKIITILIEWDDPELSARFANELIARVNEYIRNESTKESESNIFFLQQQLNETNTMNIKSVMYQLIEQQMSQIMIANSREQYAFRVIDSAIPPESPSGPNHRLAIILGFLIGLTLTLIFLFTKEALEKKD
tara:strand:+ start:762 stop:1598 length:837 start_codon:yes stop_codon:yes gene_type:complete